MLKLLSFCAAVTLVEFLYVVPSIEETSFSQAPSMIYISSFKIALLRLAPTLQVVFTGYC